MIIWGSKGKEIEEGGGQFYCPRCEKECRYKRIRIAKYFTLYFIPLFETSTLGEYVKCMNCQQEYKPQVLNFKPPSEADRLFDAIGTELKTGTPLEVARNKMLNAGMERGIIDKAFAPILAVGALRCDTCNLSYLPNITRCNSCSQPLTRRVNAIGEPAVPAMNAPAARGAELPMQSPPPPVPNEAPQELADRCHRQYILGELLEGSELDVIEEQLTHLATYVRYPSAVDQLSNDVLAALSDNARMQELLQPLQSLDFPERSPELRQKLGTLLGRLRDMLRSGGGNQAAIENAREWLALTLRVPPETINEMVAAAAQEKR